MLKTISVMRAEELKQLERKMKTQFALPETALMECAGLQSALFIEKHYPNGEVFIFLGKGGNAGDGLSAARHLYALGRVVKLIYLEGDALFKDASLVMYESIKALNVPRVSGVDAKKGVIIDAVFGSGFRGPLSEPYLSFFKQMKESSLDVISLDVPSGFEADSAQIIEGAVQATHTLAFGYYRLCHVLQPALSSMGRLHRMAIGHFAPSGADLPKIQVVEKATLPERKESGYKNTFGHVLIVGGSNGMIGAPILAGIAALRSGAGLVSVIVPELALRSSRPEHPPELMVLGLPGSQWNFGPEDASFVLDYIQKRNIDCMAFGMGLGRSGQTRPFLSALVDQTDIPLVIDTDGLAVLEMWKKPPQSRRIITTPHPGEYKTYFQNEGQSVDVAALVQKAKNLGIQIAFKSTTPIVTDGDRAWIIPTSYSSLAKAGSGDTLSGILASFLGQGFGDLTAPLAVWVHNQIGRELNRRGDAYVCTASDIAHLCHDVLKSMREIGGDL